MHQSVKQKFTMYPENIAVVLHEIRSLILQVAVQDGITELEETLKWGEASYLVNGGSTIRIDWKPKDPDVIKVYFHCQTTLVETFKEIYRDDFEYEGKRAIVIPLNAEVKEGPLGHCIELALKYHSVKHLPLLGA